MKKFIRKDRQCIMAKLLTHNEWYEKYKDKIDNTIEILGKYINNRTKILIRCKKCLKEYETLPIVNKFNIVFF